MSRKLSACNQMITFTCTEPKNYNQQRIMTDYVVALTRWNQMWWWRWRPAAHCAEQSWDTEIWFFFSPSHIFLLSVLVFHSVVLTGRCWPLSGTRRLNEPEPEVDSSTPLQFGGEYCPFYSTSVQLQLQHYLTSICVENLKETCITSETFKI